VLIESSDPPGPNPAMLRKPFGDIASNGLRNCILFSHSTMQEMVVPISLLLDPVP